jgi:hypothetical protein
MSQNMGTYKYITAPVDTCYSENIDIFEVDNRYYLFSRITSLSIYSQRLNIISIFDENLNRIDQKQFPDSEHYNPMFLFYKNNHFYVFLRDFDSLQANPLKSNPIYLAKYDKNFNLVQPVSSHVLEDTLSYHVAGLFMTKKEEFIILFSQIPSFKGYLLHIDTNGKLLHKMSLPFADLDGDLLETDSNYIMSFHHSYTVFKFSKDSLDKYEVVELEETDNGYAHDLYHDAATVAGNQLIRAYYCAKECEEENDRDRSIVFFNEDLNVENRLEVGRLCADEDRFYSSLHYLNPDSIYYAYSTELESGYAIGIANFSWDGKLNFDYSLELPEDSLPIKYVYNCKALSNGGVLVSGIASDSSLPTFNARGFLLLYHPPKDVPVKEPVIAEWKIYPNPAKDVLHIETGDAGKIVEAVELYDILGKRQYRHVRTMSDYSEITIDISHLQSGMYFVVFYNKGQKIVQKFVKH